MSYQTSDAVETYAFLSELLVWVQNQVQAQRAFEISNVIEYRLEANDLQIQRLTQTYERRLDEDLEVLEEALAIASELNSTNIKPACLWRKVKAGCNKQTPLISKASGYYRLRLLL